MRHALALLVSLAIVALGGPHAHADELDPGIVEPRPTPIVVPPGLYLVTDVYAGSVATTSGATTTYRTLTVRATPGTYARLLALVGTGVASAFDGRSFNGRGRLGDGRAIAGAYYETFVLTATGFVSVNIVFFQDDSETRAIVAPRSAPPSSTAATPAPLATPASLGTTGPSVRPGAMPSSASSGGPSTRTPAPTMPPLPIAAAGVALAQGGPTLSAIDVLRGRTVHLWPRAFIDGIPVPVRDWRLVAGAADGISRTSGSGTEAADVVWLVPASVPIVLRFEVTTEAAPGDAIPASLTVTVRSPALLQ
jgi:hypothetical protein